MEVIEYLVSNGKEIMFLCIGVGTLILTINLSRALIQAITLLKKVNKITDSVESVLIKPLQVASQINSFISRFI